MDNTTLYTQFIEDLENKTKATTPIELAEIFSNYENRDNFLSRCLSYKMREDFLKWWSDNTLKMRTLPTDSKVSLLTVLAAILTMDAKPDKAMETLKLCSEYIAKNDLDSDEVPNSNLLQMFFFLYTKVNSAEEAFRACSVFYSSVESATVISTDEVPEDNNKKMKYLKDKLGEYEQTRPRLSGPVSFIRLLKSKDIVNSSRHRDLVIARIDAGTFRLKQLYDFDLDNINPDDWYKMAIDFKDDLPSAYAIAVINDFGKETTLQDIKDLFDGVTGYMTIDNNHLDFTSVCHTVSSPDNECYEMNSFLHENHGHEDKPCKGTIDFAQETFTTHSDNTVTTFKEIDEEFEQVDGD